MYVFSIQRQCFFSPLTLLELQLQFFRRQRSHYTWFVGYSRFVTILLIANTQGSGDFDDLRPLSYPGTDAFLVCYSVIDAESLDAVESKWVPEIKQHGDSDSPIILVGTKLDLRDSNSGMQPLCNTE